MLFFLYFTFPVFVKVKPKDSLVFVKVKPKDSFSFTESLYFFDFP